MKHVSGSEAEVRVPVITPDVWTLRSKVCGFGVLGC